MSVLASGGFVHDRAPAPVDELLRMRDVAAQASQGAEVDLCLLRMRQMHVEDASTSVAAPSDVDPGKAAALSQWWESDLFTEHERACLNLTEQFVLSVGALTQEDVDALQPAWSEEQVYDFVMALYVHDLSSRAELVLDSVFGDGAAAAHEPGRG